MSHVLLETLLAQAKRVGETQQREVHSGYVLRVDELKILLDHMLPEHVWLDVDRAAGCYQLRYWKPDAKPL